MHPALIFFFYYNQSARNKKIKNEKALPAIVRRVQMQDIGNAFEIKRPAT